MVWGYAKIGDSRVTARDFFHASGCFRRGSVDLSFAKSLSPYIKRISSCLAQALRFGSAG